MKTQADWSDRSPGLLATSRCWRRQEGSQSLQAPADTLISVFQTPASVSIHSPIVLSDQSEATCYSSPRS